MAGSANSSALYRLVLKEDEDDFLWSCGQCSVTGRGEASMTRHNKNVKHGLKHFRIYVPEVRLENLKKVIRDLQGTIGELEERQPPEGSVLFEDENEVRLLVGRMLESAYSEDEFEDYNEVHDYLGRMVWNDTFWRGFMLEFHEHLEAQRLREEEHLGNRDKAKRIVLEERAAHHRLMLAEVEAELQAEA